MESPEAFIKLLRPWFLNVGLPEPLWTVLYKKLKDDVLDAGATFAIAELDEGDDEERGSDDDDEAAQPKAPGTRVLVSTQDVAPGQNVWLIDHAWTFKYRDASAQLCSDEGLRQRLAAMLSLPLTHSSVTSVPPTSTPSEPAPPQEATAVSRDAQSIFEMLWKLAGSYRPSQGERTLQEMNDADHDSIWYIMDEVGSAISHCAVGDDADGTSSSANVKVATMPVCFPEKGCVFSIFWACQPIEASGMCVAAGTYAVGGNPQRPEAPADLKHSAAVASAALFGDMLDVAAADVCTDDAADPMDDDDEGEPQASGNRLWDQCKQAFVQRATAMLSLSIAANEAASSSSDPTANGKTYPTLDKPEALVPHGLTFPIPFYTDSNLVVSALTDTDHFRLVAVPEEAKVMWMAHYVMHRSNEFPHAAFVSQMPEERFFTNKKELAAIVKQRLGFRPWFQVTYDAMTELDAFVADFMLRDAVINAKAIRSNTTSESASTTTPLSPELLRSNDGTNLWIAKPCNLARSIDMTVSNNLQWLLRAAETGPKIFCKYIANPATLRGRKFDLRFVVAVRSLHTVETCLEAYLYNVFWTRFASEQYSLDGFDVYAKHWTVMNYADPEKLLQLHYDAFIPEFNAEYERKLHGLATPWETMVQPKIRTMLRELLEALVPDDIPHDRFRGAYGIDVMLREEVDPTTGALINLEPVLLEVTFSPDCVRAVKYHPTFFNDVFQTLFLGVPSNMTRI